MADYAESLPAAVKCFDDDFEACIAHLRLPVTHRRSTRTTNLIERLFGEERRRMKIVPNAFGEKPVLKLMFGALIRAAEGWRGLRFTEFELRQLDVVRKDLDAEYEASYHPIRQAISAASFQQFRALTSLAPGQGRPVSVCFVAVQLDRMPCSSAPHVQAKALFHRRIPS